RLAVVQLSSDRGPGALSTLAGGRLRAAAVRALRRLRRLLQRGFDREVAACARTPTPQPGCNRVATRLQKWSPGPEPYAAMSTSATRARRPRNRVAHVVAIPSR